MRNRGDQVVGSHPHRASLNVWGEPPASVERMRELKARFDPAHAQSRPFRRRNLNIASDVEDDIVFALRTVLGSPERLRPLRRRRPGHSRAGALYSPHRAARCGELEGIANGADDSR